MIVRVGSTFNGHVLQFRCCFYSRGKYLGVEIYRYDTWCREVATRVRNDAVQLYGAGSRNSVRVIHK